MATVLVIDDHPSHRLALQATLGAMNESVVAVGSAREASAVLACIKVDLIITDLRMPEMSGAELASGLRQPRAPIILVSAADADDPDVRTATALPGVTFLQKPYSQTLLRQRIRTALAGH